MFMLRRSFVGFLSVALAVTACSQVPAPELAGQPEVLTPQFGTPNWDAGEKALVSRQTGSIYVSSGLLRLSSDGDRVTSREASLRRYTPEGTVIWSATFNAFTNVRLADLAEDAAGNIAVALQNYDNSKNYAELQKYSVTGQKLWRRTIANVSYIETLEMTPTGEVLAVVEGGNLYKYSRDGRLLWTRQIAPLAPGGPSGTDANGNLYTISSSSYINKYNTSGTLIWTTALRQGTATYISAKDLMVSQNALYVVGDKEWTLGESEGGDVIVETDAVVFKYSLGGAYRWGRSFGTKAKDQAVSVAVDGEQNVYITAYLNGRAAFVIRKYATTGQLLKQTATARPYNSGMDVADMVVNLADEVYLTGRTDKDLGAGYNGGNYDAFFIRLNGEGKEVWVR